jgi:uncharacterized cupredoxin-like copper-binding protein
MVLLVATIALLMVGCSSGDNGSSASTDPTASTGATTTAPASTGGTVATTVNATEKDFAISLDETQVSSGDVTFDVANQGPSTHEFVVFRTDLAQDQLPTGSDGTVNEDAKGLTHVDEVEDIASGSAGTLDVTLQPGHYVFICNLPGHYAAGMHAEVTVG